jgi:zeaxanthin glucosyltransferase
METRKVLILVWPETSAYNATFRLSRVLQQHGMQIAYAVPPAWQEHVTRQGFASMPIDDVGMRSLWSTRTPWFRRLWTARREAERLLDELCASLAWVREQGYSVVLLNHTLWHFAPAFQRLGIPVISVSASLTSHWNLEIPPLFSSLAPPRGPRPWAALRCALAWAALRYLGAYSHRYRGVLQPAPDGAGARLRDLGVALRHLFRTVSEPLHLPLYYALLRLARREGTPIRWGDYGHRLAGIEWILGPREIDFPRRRPLPSRVYVGACVDTGRSEEPLDPGFFDDPRPLVYCTLGSHGPHWNAANRRRLLRAVVQAFHARTDLRLLLQVGDPQDLDALSSLPGHIVGRPWYPQLQVLAHASLAICHGGFSTVREALFYGVPMLIFPCGVDQPGDAARVAYARVGLGGDIRTVTPEIVGAMVDEVLGDPSYRDRAQRMGRVLQAQNECTAALASLSRLEATNHAAPGGRLGALADPSLRSG